MKPDWCVAENISWALRMKKKKLKKHHEDKQIFPLNKSSLNDLTIHVPGRPWILSTT